MGISEAAMIYALRLQLLHVRPVLSPIFSRFEADAFEASCSVLVASTVGLLAPDADAGFSIACPVSPRVLDAGALSCSRGVHGDTDPGPPTLISSSESMAVVPPRDIH